MGLDGRYTDRPLDKPRVKLRISARLDTIIPGVAGGESLIRRGHDDKTGKPAAAPIPQEVVVYADAVPAIMNLVETELDSLSMAEKAFKTQYRAWLVKKTNEATWEAEQRGEPNPKYNLKTTGLSIEKCFFEIEGRGIKPLLKVDQVGDMLPPPEIPRPVDAQGNSLGLDSDVLEALIQQRIDTAVKAALEEALSKKGRKA